MRAAIFLGLILLGYIINPNYTMIKDSRELIAGIFWVFFIIDVIELVIKRK